MASQVTVILPAYNEGGSIGDVVKNILRLSDGQKLKLNVLVVDDGSNDGTAIEAQQAGAVVLRHTSNRGYGAALKTGITSADTDLICIIDADSSYPVIRIPDLVAGMESADMVVGARTGRGVAIPWARRPAKWMLNRLANFVANANIPDLNSGMRVFRRQAAMQYFHILPDQFSFTTTITMAMHCDKFAVRYLPIEYFPRKGKSKIVPWDAATFTVLILRTAMLFKPLRVFLPCAGVCLGYAVAKACWDLLVTGDRNISTTAAVAALGAMNFTLIGMLGDAIGARLRYVTSKPYVAIRPEAPEVGEFRNLPSTDDATVSRDPKAR